MTNDPVPVISPQAQLDQTILSLHESEARLRLALWSGNLGSWHWDAASGAFLDISEICKAHFGLAPGMDLSFPQFLALVHPDDQELVRRSLEESLATGREYASEYRMVWPDGTPHWISAHGHPLVDASRQTARMIGVTQDITQRKIAEQTLRDSEERYRRLIELSPDAIWINLDNKIVLVNAAAVKMLGAASADDILGKSPFDVIHPDYHGQIRARIGAMLKTNTTVAPMDEKLMRFDGELVDVEVLAVALPFQGQTAIQAVFRDITGRKRAEADLRQAVARQRVFLKDVLASVTDGRLTLCDLDSDLPLPLTPVGAPIVLSMQGGLRELRADAQEAGTRVGLSDERGFDLTIAVGEAGMNAIVHVGSGTGQVFYGKDCVQVKIVDYGAGIALENLPKATLARGFSTKATLGHGMKMMLQTVDRMFLITSASGTTVVIEQDRVPTLPNW